MLCAARRGCAGASGSNIVAEAGPGDFIYVPPFVPHQEINANPDNPLECVLVRSDNEAVVVNITDVDPVEAARDGLLGRPDPQASGIEPGQRLRDRLEQPMLSACR